MKESQFLSIPTRYEIKPFQDDRFLKVKIYVMHDKLNLNNSYFSMETIENAKESIKNIPILAFVKSTDGYSYKDFGGHESETSLSTDGELQYKYLGRPIGVIPADNNGYTYETIEGKTYAIVYGYVWKDYANEALEIIENCIEKGQSMEIRVDNGEWSSVDGYYHITDYRYTGLCVLGDDVRPAMEGAKVKIATEYTSQFSNEYHQKVNELSNILKQYSINNAEKEDEKMPEDLKVVESTEEEVKESVEEKTETEKVEDEVEEVKETKTEEVAEKVEETEKVEAKDEKLEIPIENEKPQEEDKVFELSRELTNLKSNYELLEKEVVELREFKKSTLNEKEYSQKEELFNKFNVGLTEEELKPLKENINDYSLEELKVKLNELFAEKTLSEIKEKKFSVENPVIAIDKPKKDFTDKSRYAV